MPALSWNLLREGSITSASTHHLTFTAELTSSTILLILVSRLRLPLSDGNGNFNVALYSLANSLKDSADTIGIGVSRMSAYVKNLAAVPRAAAQ